MANVHYKYCEDTNYVDIHGRDVRVLVCENTGRILVPINELKEMGFSIYRKSQYNKLLIDDDQFTHEFNLFMLQCAQSYMLKNKIAFKENEILKSINNCKKMLTDGQLETSKVTSPSSKFLQNHVVKKNSTEVSITTSCKPAPMTIQNVKLLNEQRFQSSSRHSSTSSSSENTRKSRSFDNKKPRKSFGQNNVSLPLEEQKLESFCQSKGISSHCNKNNFSRQEIHSEENKKPPLTSIELNKVEHNVFVTHVEKANVWVQNVDNADDLIEIDKKIKEELDNERPVARCEFNNIYLAKDENSWYRCKLIKFKPLMVIFIDYGNTALVTLSNLREVSKDLAQIPAQAVKVILEDDRQPSLYEAITLKIVNRKEQNTYCARIVSNETIQEENKSPVTTKAKPKPSVYFDKLKSPSDSLHHGQKVMIIGNSGQKLMVRTRESYDKLKQIEEAMEDSRLDLVHPLEGQLVVVRKDSKPYRAEVISVDSTSVKVILLDHHSFITVALSEIENISESLSKEPLTYFLTPPLLGYNSDDVTAREYVENLIKKNAKAVVVLKEGEFDLKMGVDSLLSQKLRSTSNRTMLIGMERYRPELGPGTYMLYSYCTGSVTLVAEDQVEKYLDQVLSTNMEDDEPYVPIMGEVCFGMYQGNWSRCVVVEVLEAAFRVSFIDFGNTELLTTEGLRKLTEDGKKAPVLGVPCKVIGLPPVEGIHHVIEDFLEENVCCDLTVKRFNREFYEIEVPVLIEKAQKGK